MKIQAKKNSQRALHGFISSSQKKESGLVTAAAPGLN